MSEFLRDLGIDVEHRPRKFVASEIGDSGRFAVEALKANGSVSTRWCETDSLARAHAIARALDAMFAKESE